MIQKGVDVNVKTSSGDTSCHVALRNGYSAIANLISEEQQKQDSLNTIPLNEVKKPKPNRLLLAPAPTRFKPKSPYTAFFERFAEFPEPEGNHIPVPEVIVDDFDSVAETRWFPSPGDVTRYSPEGIESAKDNFNPFNAWPGTSMIFKQAIASNSNVNRPSQFKKSISKPVSSNVAKVPLSPWSPTDERYPAMGSNNTSRYEETSSVKLPKDLSTVLVNLGLAKYQMHFEEQDIDLQVRLLKLF